MTWCGRAWFFNLLWQQSFLKKSIRSGMAGLGEVMHGVVRMGQVGRGGEWCGEDGFGWVWFGVVF